MDSSNLSPTDQIKALSPYERSIASCVYNHDSVHAQLLQRIGRLYSLLGNYSRAIDYYQRTIGLINRKAGRPSNNPKYLIRTYYWLAGSYDSLHRTSDKVKAYDSCAAIAIRLQSIDEYCLWTLLHRSQYSFDVGDYHRSLDYADLCESQAINLIRTGSKADMDLGNRYVMPGLKWSINALVMLENYDEAQSLLEKKAAESGAGDIYYDLGFIYGTLAEVLELKGDYQKVMLYQNKALAVEKKSGGSFNYKAILNEIGYAVWFKYHKNLDKALEYYKRALQYEVITKDDRTRVLNSLESLRILDRMANIYALKGEYGDALRYIQLAFDQIRVGATETEVLHSSMDQFIAYRRIGYIATLVVDKAAIYQQKYKATHDLNDVKEAVRIYKIADQFLEKIKTEQSDYRSKLFWRSDRRHLYEMAIEACYSYGNLVDAFYFFERSRAVLLYDDLNHLRLMNQDDVERQALLKKNIADLEGELANEDKSSDRSRMLQEQLMTYRQNLDQLNEQISKNPLFYQHLSQTDQINIHDVQKKLLKGNDRLVEFYNGDSAVYSMMISTSQVILDKINKDSFDRAVSEFVSLVSNYELLNKNFTTFVNGSYQLYQLIFQHHDFPAGKIIVSFDGHYFPVEALVTKKTPSPTYFIQDHPVSYAHSARLLMIDFGKTSASGGRDFLGMAPVDFHEKFNLPSLTGSDLSLQALKSNFGSTNCMTFKTASKYNFLRDFPEYQVIQLYTHASDAGQAGEPEIFFADSVLRLSELLSEKKPFAKLIVLSACETGTGQLYAGEGVFSFNRGFAALGIPSSVSNLWSIDNVSTYHLTELFYKYLGRGLPMDEALQKAKLEFIQDPTKEKSLPFYWAATILGGRSNAIESKKPQGRNVLVLAVIAVVLIFGTGLWITKRKRVKQTAA